MIAILESLGSLGFSSANYEVITTRRSGQGTGETHVTRVVRKNGEVLRRDSWTEAPSAFTATTPPPPELPQHIREHARFSEVFATEPDVRGWAHIRAEIGTPDREREALLADLKKYVPKRQRGKCRRHRTFNCTIPGC